MAQTPEERQAKKESIKAKNRAYYAQHAEKLRAYSREYRRTFPDAHRASARASYHAHREKRIAEQKTWRAAHLEERRAKDRLYNAEHVEARRAYQHAYSATQKEKIRAKNARYNAANRDKLLAQSRAYRAIHKDRLNALKRAQPDRVLEQAKRRRAKLKGAPVNDLTMAQWREIKAAYGYCCVYCGLKPRALTQDHITPLSKGGSHTASNVVPACLRCNTSKRDGAPPAPVQPLLLTLAPTKKPRKK